MEECQWAEQIWDSVALAFYSADLGTDIYTFVQHIKNGHYVWAGLTAGFTVMPMIFAIFVFAWYVNKLDWNIPKKNLVAFLGVLVSPTIPFCWMAWKICGSHRFAKRGVGKLKLFEAFGESLPQAGLQMFVVFDGLRSGTPIETYQWITIAVSLGFLSFAVTTSYLFEHRSTYTKVTFFIFFLLAVASHFMVCCVFSLLHFAFWFMPISTELVIILIMVGILKYCNRVERKMVILLITLASIINLTFAIAGFCSVATHPRICSVTLFLSVMNCIAVFQYTYYAFTNQDAQKDNTGDVESQLAFTNQDAQNDNTGDEESQFAFTSQDVQNDNTGDVVSQSSTLGPDLSVNSEQIYDGNGSRSMAARPRMPPPRTIFNTSSV